jgi:hypothetical protein
LWAWAAEKTFTGEIVALIFQKSIGKTITGFSKLIGELLE